MRIESIWQFPVKSMQGGTVPNARLTADGIVGDRTWATRDEVRGGIRGAKQLGGLMRFAAEYVGGPDGHTGPVAITFPDGSTVRTDEPDLNTRVSAALDHAVTLWPLQPSDDLDHYRRGPSDTDDVIAGLRAVFGRDEDEPLPDLSIFPPAIMEFESPPGTYLDAFPLMIMTTSALRSLAESLPDSAVDVRRFRPSLVVDTGDEPGHPETSWVGRQLVIASDGADGSTDSVVLDVVAGCPRCVMVTREVAADLPADRRVLRHIVRDLDQNVGVYATVAVPGRIAAGATVSVR